MKKLFLILSITYCFAVKAQTTNGLLWHNNIEEALQKATKENKKTLVYFSGSDWCKPCIELKKEVFNTSLFIKKATKEYVLVNIDFPRNRKKLTKKQIAYIEKSAEKYNKKGVFPMVAVLNKNGEISVSINGYKSETASYYIKNYLE